MNWTLKDITALAEGLPYPSINPKGVIKLIWDLADQIDDFQTESSMEDQNVIHGLNFLITKIKQDHDLE